jgi:hypothetical protein
MAIKAIAIDPLRKSISGVREEELYALPHFIEPEADEAMLSWLLRFGSRMGVSLSTIGRVFSVTHGSLWWCRPDPWLVARVSEKTGVTASQLKGLTFNAWHSVYRDDEAHERFSGRRFHVSPPARRELRYALCNECFKEDPRPYLRRSWLMGWLAICPRHECLLTTRCSDCGAILKVPTFGSVHVFTPQWCRRCGSDFTAEEKPLSHPGVARLQGILLRGKVDGTTTWDGLGKLQWTDTIALIDVLIGTLWTGIDASERERIVSLYLDATRDEIRDAAGAYGHRYGSLRFLTWITSGWPDSEPAGIAKDLLKRWLESPRNRVSGHLRGTQANPWTRGPNNFETSVRERLQALATTS